MYRKQLKSVDSKKTKHESHQRQYILLSPYRQQLKPLQGNTQEFLNIRNIKKRDAKQISNTFNLDLGNQSSFNSFFAQSPQHIPVERVITDPRITNTSRRRVETLHTYLTDHQGDEESKEYINNQGLRLRLKLYFNQQKISNRLLNLISVMHSNDLPTLTNYFTQISASLIEILGGQYKQYKRFIINECIGLILLFMLKKSITTGMDKNKWERMLICYHQANTIQVIQVLRLQIKGIQQYLHQYQQFQSINPIIPSQVELINMLIEQNIDRLIKNIIENSLQQQLTNYRESSIDASFQYYQQKLKVILVNLERHFYLIPQNSTVYTLVLDLDETLVHLNEDTQEVIVRPYTPIFIEQMAKHYEIVVFTAGIQSYADKVIDEIDVTKVVKYRLYRHHTLCEDTHLLKDLTTLGRPLSKVVIVDNNPYSFALQPQNGIRIKTWIGDQNDRALAELIQYLIQLKQYEDIRIGLKELKINSKYFTTSS